MCPPPTRKTLRQALAAPLPVVLQSKTGTSITQYVYALGTRPLAQNGGSWQYLLPDALGNVRQIANAGGNVILTESYEPCPFVNASSHSAAPIRPLATSPPRHFRGFSCSLFRAAPRAWRPTAALRRIWASEAGCAGEAG